MLHHNEGAKLINAVEVSYRNCIDLTQEYYLFSSQEQWPNVCDENSPNFIENLGKAAQDKEIVNQSKSLDLDKALEVSQDVCMDEINSTLVQLTSNIKRLLAEH